MTTVASIVKARAASRANAENQEANTRLRIFLKAVIGILLVMGLGATISASSVVAAKEGLNFAHYGGRQMLFALAGVVVMGIAARIDHTWYRRVALPIFLIALAGLAATLVVGVERGGAKRWIALGFTDLQPSELAKFGVIVALAAVLVRKEESGLLDDIGHLLAPVAAILGSVALLVMLQPDLGTTLVIGACGLGVILASRAKRLHLLGLLGLAGVLGALAAVVAGYRMDRVRAWLDPDADVGGIAYHLNQSLAALGSGGYMGVGIGESRFRWAYLPNAHTDFIFSIIGEELGFAGTMFMVGLWVAFTVIGIIIAHRAPDRFGRLLAAGITSWLSLQAFVNIGGVIGLIPITGMTLPFVSYGGSSLLVSMGAVGVLLSVAAKGRTPAGASTGKART